MMTDKIPPDWVLLEAAKRRGWGWEEPLTSLRSEYTKLPTFQALCDMIEKYEQPPVDRKLLCAREAAAIWQETYNADCHYAPGLREGFRDFMPEITVATRAIELWEEGFGK